MHCKIEVVCQHHATAPIHFNQPIRKVQTSRTSIAQMEIKGDEIGAPPLNVRPHWYLVTEWSGEA